MPDDGTLVPDPEATRVLVNDRLNWGRLFWKPFHDRQDYGLTMYLLLDAIQQVKPIGYRRFVSNDPRTSVDAGVSILTRNLPYWQIDMPSGMLEDEREGVGKIERLLSGVVDDMDEMFAERGEGPFWKQAAFFAVQRGAVFGKFWVTKQALAMGRQSPLLGEFWDSRQVYPNYDGIGLESICVEKMTNLNELLMQYGAKVRAQFQNRSVNLELMDPNSRATKIEYWSNDRPDETKPGGIRKGIYGVLGYFHMNSDITDDPINSESGSAIWLVPPVYHGYKPDALPVVGIPVNGIPIKSKPIYGNMVTAGMANRARELGVGRQTWHDPSGWVAEWGRGLLTGVEEHIPQYNELVATILQHLSISTYPTWAFKTMSGALPEFEDGINAKVPLRIGESIERFDPHPMNQDAYRILDLLQDERQRGMLNSILLANGALSSQSGIVLTQAVNAALNSLEPFSDGLKNFGTMFASRILQQLRVADTGALRLSGRSPRSYFWMEFDPKTELDERKYKPIPIFRPAVPDDLYIRAQTARILLDPRRPIASLVTVLDKVLQWDDPEGELKRIWHDVANLDPVIVLEHVASVLEEEGFGDIAERVRENQFQQRFVQEMRFRAETAQLGQVAGNSTIAGEPSATGAGMEARPGQGGSAGGPSGNMGGAQGLGAVGGTETV